MTIDEKKKWLYRYKDIKVKIESLTRQRKELYSMMMHITPTFSDVPPSGYGDGANKMAKNYEKIEKKSEDIAKAMSACFEVQDEINAAINSVADERLRNILMLRIIENRYRKIVHDAAEEAYYSRIDVALTRYSRMIMAAMLRAGLASRTVGRVFLTELPKVTEQWSDYVECGVGDDKMEAELSRLGFRIESIEESLRQ